jgi:hypothetical protein
MSWPPSISQPPSHTVDAPGARALCRIWKTGRRSRQRRAWFTASSCLDDMLEREVLLERRRSVGGQRRVCKLLLDDMQSCGLYGWFFYRSPIDRLLRRCFGSVSSARARFIGAEAARAAPPVPGRVALLPPPASAAITGGKVTESHPGKIGSRRLTLVVGAWRRPQPRAVEAPHVGA